MTLDAGKLVASGAWLMGPGRLEGIRFALDTLTLTLYSNALLDHVECPEIRCALPWTWARVAPRVGHGC